MFYFIYSRLGLHVAASDGDLMQALDDYADENIKGGSAVLTADHRAAIRREHEDARKLYAAVTSGRL